MAVESVLNMLGRLEIRKGHLLAVVIYANDHPGIGKWIRFNLISSEIWILQWDEFYFLHILIFFVFSDANPIYLSPIVQRCCCLWSSSQLFMFIYSDRISTHVYSGISTDTFQPADLLICTSSQCILLFKQWVILFEKKKNLGRKLCSGMNML